MKAELVSIATDTVALDGLFYEPEGEDIIGAVLLFHGNTMIFMWGRRVSCRLFLCLWGMPVLPLIAGGMIF